MPSLPFCIWLDIPYTAGHPRFSYPLALSLHFSWSFFILLFAAWNPLAYVMVCWVPASPSNLWASQGQRLSVFSLRQLHLQFLECHCTVGMQCVLDKCRNSNQCVCMCVCILCVYEFCFLPILCFSRLCFLLFHTWVYGKYLACGIKLNHQVANYSIRDDLGDPPTPTTHTHLQNDSRSYTSLISLGNSDCWQ